MNFFLKEDEYWKSQTGSNMEFMRYGVAGYSGDTPEFCVVRLNINWKDRNLEYPAIECSTPTWTFPTSFRTFPLPGTQHQHIEQALRVGTMEFSLYNNLLPPALSTAGVSFSEAPPTIQRLAAIAATLIEVEGQFNPESVGGITTVGVIIKGQKPAIAQFR